MHHVSHTPGKSRSTLSNNHARMRWFGERNIATGGVQRGCHDFCRFSNISLPKSQAPTLVHSTHGMFSLSLSTQSLSYLLPHLFFLSSYSVILDIKDKSGLFGLLGDLYP